MSDTGNTPQPVDPRNEIIEALRRELDVALENEGKVCGDCDGSGWLENRVEGKYPCTCMTEAEPYQLLQQQLAAMTAERDEWKQGQEAALCKVDRLTEQLAAMTTERDRLQTIDLDLQMAVQKLTASQARDQQLREALEQATKMFDEFSYRRMMEGVMPFKLIPEALALPTDDTALRQAKAKVLRDTADNYNGPSKGWVRDFLRGMADGLEKP